MPESVTKPKHIVVAVTLAKPGGAQTFVLQLATFLRDKGHQVTVIAGEGDWLFERCAESNLPFRRVPFLGREIHPLRDIQATIELKRLLSELKPDALHLNSSKMGVVGSIAGKLSLVPRIVYCIAGWSFLEALSSFKKRIYIFAERYSAAYKDVIVCLHAGDKEIATKLHIRGHEETQIIPNGIDLSTLDRERSSRDEARRILGLPSEGYCFGTIAHFYPAKDLPRYLEACAIVHAQAPDARFILIGEGQERQAIEAARTRLGLEDTVLLLGARDHAARYLLAFDAFVLPSTKEGMPYTILEAMAAALPCIVTDVGANRWTMEDTGWIVPPQSPQPLAQAMLETLHNRTHAQEKGLAARSMVEARFPLERTLEAHERLLLQQSK